MTISAAQQQQQQQQQQRGDYVTWQLSATLRHL